MTTVAPDLMIEQTPPATIRPGRARTVTGPPVSQPTADGGAGAAFRDGVRAMAVVFVPAIPFAIVIGIAIAESDRMSRFEGWLTAPLLFGGAAQYLAIRLISDGSSAVAVLSAAILVNLRHLMYSAALVPRFRGQPGWFRIVGPYLLIDQMFALSSARPPGESPREWRAYYLGAGLTVAVLWYLANGLAIVFGQALPAKLDLSFAVPVMFIGLTAAKLSSRPLLFGAATAAVAAALLSELPGRAGMLVGAVAGVVVAVLVDEESRS